MFAGQLTADALVAGEISVDEVIAVAGEIDVIADFVLVVISTDDCLDLFIWQEKQFH